MQQQKNQITVFVFNLIAVIFLISLRLLISPPSISAECAEFHLFYFLASHHQEAKEEGEGNGIMSTDRPEAHKINDLKFERHTHAIYHMVVSSIR